jgi:mersacidin/lichenicidin family type 2 lantibiotic
MAGQPEMDKKSEINKQFAKLAADTSVDRKLKQRLSEEPVTVLKEYGIPVHAEAYKIIRAWKDPNYRNSLSDAERAALPPNPAGEIEIGDAALRGVVGGLSLFTDSPELCAEPTKICTVWGCPTGEPDCILV